MNPTHPTPTGPVTVDPDAAFLGCLMRCDAATARRLLAGMVPNDVAQPIAGEVLALAIQLAARELSPDPAVLLAEARRQGRLSTEHKHELLADWLIDTYRAAPDPVVGSYLKAAVLEAAYRRALREHALRMLHRVDHADTAELADLGTPDDRATDLAKRHLQATHHETERPITPTDPIPAPTSQLSAISQRLCQDRSPSARTPGTGTEQAASANSDTATEDRRNAA